MAEGVIAEALQALSPAGAHTVVVNPTSFTRQRPGLPARRAACRTST